MPGWIVTGDGKKINFGEYPVRMVCPTCREEIETETVLKPGSLVWALIVVLLLLPLLWP